MPFVSPGRALAWGLALSTFASSCATAQGRRHDAQWRDFRADERAAAAPVDDRALADAPHLDRAAVIAAVLVRNPDVAAAREGWHGALARYRQATAVGDPMLRYEVAPLSVTGDARFGQRIALSQTVPFPGKRRLAGEAALDEADAARGEVAAARLELAQMASELYDDYFAAARALDINDHHRALVAQLRQGAEAQYVAGRGGQADLLAAEVELGQIERERLGLEAERDLVVAQLNGLLHRAPDARLAPPPERLDLAGAVDGTAAELEARALAARPQRQASQARLRAAGARIALAERESYPDLELMGSYDSMWDMPEHRWMLGIALELPLDRGRRAAMVDEAAADSARMRREDERLADAIRVDVARAHRRVVEQAAVVAVYEQKILPAARARADAARNAYTAGQAELMAAIEADKGMREVELEIETARAELSRRRAALARAVGVLPPGGAP